MSSVATSAVTRPLLHSEETCQPRESQSSSYYPAPETAPVQDDDTLSQSSFTTSAAEPSPLLSQSTFQTERSQQLLQAIHELSSSGVSHEIDLPQLVIVGDQSSGKSSLLQSLTDIPFPVAESLCTRFATRIISRRSPSQEEITKISIQENGAGGMFDFRRPDGYKERYKNFNPVCSNITGEDFRRFVEEAAELMGVPKLGASPQAPPSAKKNSIFPRTRNFSRDVLVIEISGPDRSPFQIVDVPGLFHTALGMVETTDIAVVTDMVSHFMKMERSIIVCVANGVSELANQIVFQQVLSVGHDPKGARTVRVITKCDASQHVDQIIRLAQNETKPLSHGWFVVRNRTPAEVRDGIGSDERHKREQAFFSEQPWIQLPENRRGSRALKLYLANLLCKRIEEVFPTLAKEIKERKESTEHQLAKLGQSRKNPRQRRTFLTSLSQQIHAISREVIDGRYDQVFDKKDLKLRMLVRQANDEFSDEMEMGHYVPFSDIQQTGPERLNNQTRFNLAKQAGGIKDNEVRGTAALPFNEYVEMDPDGATLLYQSLTTMNECQGSSFEELRLADYKRENTDSQQRRPFGQAAASRKPSGFDRPATTEPANTETEIYYWIQAAIEDNRGTELPGTLNPYILPKLFKEQSRYWGEIAEEHFGYVCKLTESYAEGILDLSCIDEFVVRQLRGVIETANKSAKARGLARLREIVQDVASSTLQTSDQTFQEKVSQARLRRFEAALRRYKARTPKVAVGMIALNSATDVEVDPNVVLLNLRDTESIFREIHISNEENLQYEIHDTLKAYYELELKKFVENINKQVVERYLDDEDGPVLFFSPAYVGLLNDEEVKDLAKEDDAAVVEREKAEASLERLVRAERIVEGYI
ncbi:MAG: hypothetical protein M1819_004794 [Sarea resinae]|nr:MAG: hypothetical protein M1819_004794 [Sarea resinae]